MEDWLSAPVRLDFLQIAIPGLGIFQLEAL
jgi:hypothetical protein